MSMSMSMLVPVLCTVLVGMGVIVRMVMRVVCRPVVTRSVHAAMPADSDQRPATVRSTMRTSIGACERRASPRP